MVTKEELSSVLKTISVLSREHRDMSETLTSAQEAATKNLLRARDAEAEVRRLQGEVDRYKKQLEDMKANGIALGSE